MLRIGRRFLFVTTDTVAYFFFNWIDAQPVHELECVAKGGEDTHCPSKYKQDSTDLNTRLNVKLPLPRPHS